jgi:hypothetical protein
MDGRPDIASQDSSLSKIQYEYQVVSPEYDKNYFSPLHSERQFFYPVV